MFLISLLVANGLTTVVIASRVVLQAEKANKTMQIRPKIESRFEFFLTTFVYLSR